MFDANQLADALRERGFSPLHSVRLTAVGRRKIMVIKAVRELTGWGLAEAKHATEKPHTIVELAERETAELAADRLREAGASAELVIAEQYLYAYDPNDARRGNQPIERLRIAALELAHEHGQLGAWPQAAPRVACENTAALLEAVDELRASWSACGKREAAREIDVLGRLSARELASEERLRASVGEERLREATVYGDWLQSAGDPRGTIAAVTLAHAAGEANVQHRQQLAALIDAHTPHLFGPTAPLLEQARSEWIGPVLDSLALANGIARASADELRALLGLPICACLLALTLSQRLADERRLAEVLAAAPCAPGLRELRLPCVRELSLTGDRFARLETLVIGEGRIRVGPARLPALRSLAIDLHPPLCSLLDCFTGLEAPKLEHFTLRLTAYDFWDQNFGSAQSSVFELLRQPSFARLRSLTFALSSESVRAYTGFAELLVQIPAIATLERIDLSGVAMTADCRRELEAHRDRLPGLLLADQPG